MKTKFVRPNCNMAMIVTAGFDLEREHQTFECLRCGHIEVPEAKQPAPPVRAQTIQIAASF